MPDESDANRNQGDESENIQVPPISKPVAGAAAGALIGSIAGPVGAAVGGAVGALAGKSAASGKPFAPKVRRAVRKVMAPSRMLKMPFPNSTAKPLRAGH